MHESVSQDHLQELENGSKSEIEKISSELLGELAQLREKLDLTTREKQQLQIEMMSIGTNVITTLLSSIPR